MGCNNLGRMYDDGHGNFEDYAQAVTLYRKACDGGESAGCNNLGSMYNHGHGVTKDYAKAGRLLSKACEWR